MGLPIIEVEKIDHQLAVITHQLYIQAVLGDLDRVVVRLNAAGRVVEKQYKYWIQ